jgi:ABC-type transporter Mla MlaB component
MSFSRMRGLSIKETPKGRPAVDGSCSVVQTPVSAQRPLHESDTVILVIDGPIARVAIPGLCDRVQALLKESNAGLVVCDMRALVDPDADTVDALARLQLTTRRSGRQLRLRHACGALRDLLALMGLDDVVQVDTAS